MLYYVLACMHKEGESSLSGVEVAALGAALGADAFSVAVGVGLGGVRWKQTIKLTALFGGFQGALLIAGGVLAANVHWLLEKLAGGWGPLSQVARQVDLVLVQSILHILLSLAGAAMLVYVGVGLIRNCLVTSQQGGLIFLHGRWAVLTLSLSVSIDAFSAGLGLGMLDRTNLPTIALGVALITALMSVVGLRAGKSIGKIIGRRAELVGGFVLIVLAIRITWQMLMLS